MPFHPTNEDFTEGHCCEGAVILSDRPREAVCAFSRSRSGLAHTPKARPPELGTTCLAFAVDEASYSTDAVEFGVLVNVFNADSKLRHVLTQLLKMTRHPWELIVNFDGCSDDSLAVARAVLERSASWPVCDYAESDLDMAYVWKTGANITTNQGDIGRECWLPDSSGAAIHSTLARVRLLNTHPAGLFATASDNLKMLASRAPYYILVDDDQLMTVPGWNVKLAHPLRMWDDVVSASMRCMHGYPVMGALTGPKCTDTLAVQPTDAHARCTFYVGDSGNRGPLILRARYAHHVGYLDEVHFAGVLTEGGDHDFNARAYNMCRWVAGYVPVDYTEERCCRSPSAADEQRAVDAYTHWFWERRAAAGRRSQWERGPGTASAGHEERRLIADPAFDGRCGEDAQ